MFGRIPLGIPVGQRHFTRRANRKGRALSVAATQVVISYFQLFSRGCPRFTASINVGVPRCKTGNPTPNVLLVQQVVVAEPPNEHRFLDEGNVDRIEDSKESAPF